MINLAWGGFTNGSVPASALSAIDGQGHKLEHVAAAKYLAMRAALLQAVGRTIDVAPGADSANRTLSQQQADYALYQRGGNVAAVPGTSNHGWARAVDITGYEGNSRWISPNTGNAYYVDLPVWLWLQAHAAEYGFHWATGDASGEGWHWESYNTPSAVATAAVAASPIPAPPESEDYTMTQGAFYRLDDTQPALGALAAGSILYQENPGEPLLHLTAEQWLGFSANKNTYATVTTQQLQALINVVGLYDADPKTQRRVPAQANHAAFNGFSVYLP